MVVEKRTQHKDTSQTGTYALVVGVLMVYNNLSSTKQMRSKQTNDLTFIEVAIVGTTVAIVGTIVAMCPSMVNGNSILPSKQQCINGGGKWTEGIQYGRMTQLCTYN